MRFCAADAVRRLHLREGRIKDPCGKYTRHGKYAPEAVIRIPGGVPAIISEEDFRRVQVMMKERQHKAAKFSAKQEYLLSGTIFCGVCGNPYTGNSRKPRSDHPLYVSYKCSRRNGRVTTCRNPEINRLSGSCGNSHDGYP